MFIVNVEAAIYKNDKWLIIRRSLKEEHASGQLSLVGGKVEKEANSVNILERTIKREVFEEVDLTIEEPKYIHSTSFITDNEEHVINIIFLCEYNGGQAIAKNPDDRE